MVAIPLYPKIQASDWLAQQEEIINSNNSLFAPIRGLDFGVFWGIMELSPSTTLNLQSRSASIEKIETGTLLYSILIEGDRWRWVNAIKDPPNIRRDRGRGRSSVCTHGCHLLEGREGEMEGDDNGQSDLGQLGQMGPSAALHSFILHGAPSVCLRYEKDCTRCLYL